MGARYVVRPSPDLQRIRFGPFEANSAAGELRKDGQIIRLQEQPFQVLLALIHRPGEVVTREELRARLWPADAFGEFDQGLNTAINKLREALGDSAANPSYIETLPKRGYRFIAAIEPRAVESRPPPKIRRPRWQVAAGLAIVTVGLAFVLWARAGLVRSADTTIAVLSFADLSEGKQSEYFAHGLTEELISRLSRVDGLRVAGRASAFALGPSSNVTQTAKRLRVRNLLTGSVRAEGDRIRVTVQLVDAQEDVTVWSQNYDRNRADVLAVQEEIAHSVASALKERFGLEGTAGRPLHRPSNVEAYNLFLRALYVGRKSTAPALEQAIRMLQQVIQVEPRFAAAHAHLAHFMIRKEMTGLSGSSQGTLKTAKLLAERAAELDPASADAQMVMGYSAMRHFDWQEARTRLDKALELDPNHSRARDLRASVHIIHGNVDDSMRESRRATELDPLSLMVNRDRGLFQYLARRYDDALRTLQEVQRLDPEFPWTYYTASVVHLQMRNCPEAMASVKKHTSLIGVPTVRGALVTAICVGPDPARQLLEEVYKVRGNEVPAADVYLAIGDKERALKELETFAEHPLNQPVGGFWFLKVDPTYDGLRGEPRFQAVLRKLNLD